MKIKNRFVLIFSIAFCLVSYAQNTIPVGPAFRKGQKITRTTRVEFNVKTSLKFAGQLVEKFDQNVTESDKRQETVLETDGNTISKLRVYYENRDTSHKIIDSDGIERTGDKKDKPINVTGKTYIVTVDGQNLNITNEGGEIPPNGEREIVKKEYNDLADPQSFSDLFKDKTLEPGQQIRVPRELARDFFKNRTAKIESFLLTYKGSRKFSGMDVHAFDTKVKLSAAADDNTSMKMDLTGEVLVHATHGWPASTNLQGPMRVTGTDQVGSRILLVDGIGIISISETMQIR